MHVCLPCKRGYLMIGWDSPLRDCTGKQRVAMVTVKGEGGGCVWCASSGEMDIGGGASDAFCGPMPFLLLTKSLLSFSSCLPHRSLVVVLKWVGGCKENKRWISMRQLRGNSFSLCLSLIVPLFFIYKQHNSARSGYYTVYQQMFNDVDVL